MQNRPAVDWAGLAKLKFDAHEKAINFASEKEIKARAAQSSKLIQALQVTGDQLTKLAVEDEKWKVKLDSHKDLAKEVAAVYDTSETQKIIDVSLVEVDNKVDALLSNLDKIKKYVQDIIWAWYNRDPKAVSKLKGLEKVFTIVDNKPEFNLNIFNHYTPTNLLNAVYKVVPSAQNELFHQLLTSELENILTVSYGVGTGSWWWYPSIKDDNLKNLLDAQLVAQYQEHIDKVDTFTKNAKEIEAKVNNHCNEMQVHIQNYLQTLEKNDLNNSLVKQFKDDEEEIKYCKQETLLLLKCLEGKIENELSSKKLKEILGNTCNLKSNDANFLKSFLEIYKNTYKAPVNNQQESQMIRSIDLRASAHNQSLALLLDKYSVVLKAKAYLDQNNVEIFRKTLIQGKEKINKERDNWFICFINRILYGVTKWQFFKPYTATGRYAEAVVGYKTTAPKNR